MNKRIRELAEQAGIDFFNCTNPEHGDREYCEAWTEQQQKFAELIVKECMSLMKEQKDCYNNPGTYENEEYYIRMKAKADAFDDAVSIIKNHFGVEVGVNPEKDEILPEGHLCPYNMEINDDYQTLCDCDEEATEQCALAV